MGIPTRSLSTTFIIIAAVMGLPTRSLSARGLLTIVAVVMGLPTKILSTTFIIIIIWGSHQESFYYFSYYSCSYGAPLPTRSLSTRGLSTIVAVVMGLPTKILSTTFIIIAAVMGLPSPPGASQLGVFQLYF